MLKPLFVLMMAFLSTCQTGWAAEAQNTPTDNDHALTNDAAPSNVPAGYGAYDKPNFPQVPPPESEMVKPYGLPQHRFLQGSIHHPNPAVLDESFSVSEQDKTVKLAGSHKLYAFKDWAQERYFDAKFETLNKRFMAIEEKQTELEARLRVLEQRAK